MELGYFFEDIELFFSHLEIYLKTTPPMTDINVKMMEQMLFILAIVEEDREQGSLSKLIPGCITSLLAYPAFQEGS